MPATTSMPSFPWSFPSFCPVSGFFCCPDIVASTTRGTGPGTVHIFVEDSFALLKHCQVALSPGVWRSGCKHQQIDPLGRILRRDHGPGVREKGGLAEILGNLVVSIFHYDRHSFAGSEQTAEAIDYHVLADFDPVAVSENPASPYCVRGSIISITLPPRAR